MDREGAAASAAVRTKPYPAGPGASEWVLPSGSSDPDPAASGAILFLHGSGLSKGSPASHRPLVSKIVDALGMPALVPDYRLAPEHRFPAALVDALESYSQLTAICSPERIVVMGDSAGGGLAISTILAARDLGMALPAAVVTMSAWTDMAVTGDPRPDVDDPRVKPEMLREAAENYLDGADPKQPAASPLYGDFSGFPPLLMQVGGREIMIEDTLRLCAAAQSAGATAEYEVYEGMAHVFQLNHPHEAATAKAIEAIARFTKRVLNGGL